MYKNEIRQSLMWLVNICEVADQLVHFSQIPTTVKHALHTQYSILTQSVTYGDLQYMFRTLLTLVAFTPVTVMKQL